MENGGRRGRVCLPNRKASPSVSTARSPTPPGDARLRRPKESRAPGVRVRPLGWT